MNTTPAPQSPRGDGRQVRRQQRIQTIVDGARVRYALGQGALHEFTDGVHVVVFAGERFIGQTVDAAIQAAREGRT